MRKKPEIKFEIEGIYELRPDSIFDSLEHIDDWGFRRLDEARRQKTKFASCSFFNSAMVITRWGFLVTKECLLELLHYADLTINDFIKYKKKLNLRIDELDWFYRFSKKWLNNMNKIQ